MISCRSCIFNYKCKANGVLDVATGCWLYSNKIPKVEAVVYEN